MSFSGIKYISNLGGEAEMSETENVCNMPELFTMELHRSEQTSKLYLNFISWIGPTEIGNWTEIEVKGTDVENLLNIVKKGKIIDD